MEISMCTLQPFFSIELPLSYAIPGKFLGLNPKGSNQLFKTTPGGVFAVPYEIAVFVCHLPRDADLVTVEVAGYDLLHTSYFEIEGFMRAMAYYTYYIYTTLR